MNRNIHNSGFDLPKTFQTNTKIKCAKALTSVLAAFIVTGCVSQQSSFDFAGTPVPQPVASGVTLGGNTSELSSSTASNIPVKAPRPATNLVAQVPAQTTPSVTPAVNVEQATAQTTQVPQIAGTLAVVGANTQTPTANVIAQAATTPITPTAAIPNPTPVAIPQTQTSVEVASLSPTVEAAPTVQIPQESVAKKKTFFEQMFAPKEAKPRPVAGVNTPKIQKPTRASSRIATANSIAERPTRTANTPKIKRPNKIVASVRPTNRNSGNALPGVKSNSEIFGIKDESATSSNSANTTQVAAVGSFGRLSPNGLRVQHSKVQVSCLKPAVLRILKMVERRYGKKPIVTSGYRSPKGNRRAGGARNSQHIFCKAVDIQVEGVSKWQLAKYLRTVPGRGGVGTYCRTKSVHIDVGSVRDWHHPCRKSSKRKRKKA